MTPTLTLAVLAVILLAMLLRAVFGFGDAMFAIPLLAALVGLERGAPVLALSGTVMALLLLRERPSLVDRGALSRLLLGALLGTPLGLLLLVELPAAWAHGSLGLLLVSFGLWQLGRRANEPAADTVAPDTAAPDTAAADTVAPDTATPDTVAPDTATPDTAAPDPLGRWLRDLGFGALTGATSAAFDIAGPPMLAYAAVRRWSDDALRVNLQAVFLPLGIVTITGHGLAGLWTREVLLLAALGLPVMLLGYVLGPHLRRRVQARFGDRAGQRLLLLLIVALGVFELANSL